MIKYWIVGVLNEEKSSTKIAWAGRSQMVPYTTLLQEGRPRVQTVTGCGWPPHAYSTRSHANEGLKRILGRGPSFGPVRNVHLLRVVPVEYSLGDIYLLPEGYPDPDIKRGRNRGATPPHGDSL